MNYDSIEAIRNRAREIVHELNECDDKDRAKDLRAERRKLAERYAELYSTPEPKVFRYNWNECKSLFGFN